MTRGHPGAGHGANCANCRALCELQESILALERKTGLDLLVPPLGLRDARVRRCLCGAWVELPGRLPICPLPWSQCQECGAIHVNFVSGG